MMSQSPQIDAAQKTDFLFDTEELHAMAADAARFVDDAADGA